MLLGIEPRNCKVCQQGLYRDKTMLRGGWSRCAVCDEFVHYSCLASGRISFLKARPRIWKTCRHKAFFVQKEFFPLFNISDNDIFAMHSPGPYESLLFQLYDGTLVLGGCDKLLWLGDIPMNQEAMQVLPPEARRFLGGR